MTTLWSGKPRQGLILKRIDIFYLPILFALIFITYGLIQDVRVITSLNFDFYITYAWMYGICIYSLFGRNWIDAYYRSHITYTITDEKVFIFYKNIKTPYRSYDRKIIKPTLLKISNEYGAVELGNYISRHNLLKYRTGWPCKEMLLNRIENIREARHVYDILM